MSSGDNMDLDAIFFTSGLIIGALASFFLREKYLERKIARLESENSELGEHLYSYQQKERNAKGLMVQKEKAERQQSLMLEFAQLMQQPNPDVKQVLQSMASKYPDVAMDLVKKGLKL